MGDPDDAGPGPPAGEADGARGVGAQADEEPRVEVPAEGAADRLPDELDASGYVGPYRFPNINRRRYPGWLYLLTATACLALWALRGGDAVLVNRGFLWVAVVLAAIGAYHLATAWDLAVSETDALVAATREVGFPVGHASAQLGWRGLRSRPTWRILLYSADDPPAKRGLVLVDGVAGDVLGHYVEDNPEEW